MDLETAYYIIHFFPSLKTAKEAAALRHVHATFKLGKPDNYKSLETYEQRLKTWKQRYYFSEDPEVLKLLENGLDQFYLDTAQRILKETPDKVYFNNCPVCNLLARTPYARQCKQCGHSWHNTIAANFKINKIFQLQQRPEQLFFSGEIKSGIIKERMNIDLTFLGVGIKPQIESTNILDIDLNRKQEVVLGVIIEDKDDREYLKRIGGLAIPIIIEKENHC